MWVRTRFIFAVFIPSIALLFTLAYLGFEKWVTWKIFGILSLQPLLTLFAVWTNHLPFTVDVLHDQICKRLALRPLSGCLHQPYFLDGQLLFSR